MVDLLETKLLEIDPNWNPFTSGNPENIYTDARYTAALQAVLSQYSTTPSLFPPGEMGTGPGFGGEKRCQEQFADGLMQEV
jgi:hypothetical protein